MRRFAAPCTLLVLLARAAAAQAPYRVTWWDGASVVAAGALGAIPHLAGLPNGAPPCGNPVPCDPASLSRFDRIALHNLSGTAGTASTVARFDRTDRKSTRLNSSHPSISYAVFCLK